MPDLLEKVTLELFIIYQLEFQKFKLREKKFVEFEAKGGLRKFLAVFGIMYVDQRVTERHQVQLLHHLARHGLGNDILDLGQQVGGQFGDRLGVERLLLGSV